MLKTGSRVLSLSFFSPRAVVLLTNEEVFDGRIPKEEVRCAFSGKVKDAALLDARHVSKKARKEAAEILILNCCGKESMYGCDKGN